MTEYKTVKEYREAHKEEAKAYQLKYRLAHGQDLKNVVNKSSTIIYCETCTPEKKGKKSHCLECFEYYRVY